LISVQCGFVDANLGDRRWRTFTSRPARRAIAKGPLLQISLSKIMPAMPSAHSRRSERRLIGPRAKATRRSSRAFGMRMTRKVRTTGDLRLRGPLRRCGALPGQPSREGTLLGQKKMGGRGGRPPINARTGRAGGHNDQCSEHFAIRQFGLARNVHKLIMQHIRRFDGRFICHDAQCAWAGAAAARELTL